MTVGKMCLWGPINMTTVAWEAQLKNLVWTFSGATQIRVQSAFGRRP
jgi:hypothetical protein